MNEENNDAHSPTQQNCTVINYAEQVDIQDIQDARHAMSEPLKLITVIFMFSLIYSYLGFIIFVMFRFHILGTDGSKVSLLSPEFVMLSAFVFITIESFRPTIYGTNTVTKKICDKILEKFNIK